MIGTTVQLDIASGGVLAADDSALHRLGPRSMPRRATFVLRGEPPLGPARSQVAQLSVAVDDLVLEFSVRGKPPSIMASRASPHRVDSDRVGCRQWRCRRGASARLPHRLRRRSLAPRPATIPPRPFCSTAGRATASGQRCKCRCVVPRRGSLVPLGGTPAARDLDGGRRPATVRAASVRTDSAAHRRGGAATRPVGVTERASGRIEDVQLSGVLGVESRQSPPRYPGILATWLAQDFSPLRRSSILPSRAQAGLRRQ